MRAQGLGQKPRGYVEVFVVGLSEAAAVGAGFVEGGRDVGDAIGGRKRGPALGEEFVGLGGGGHAAYFSGVGGVSGASGVRLARVGLIASSGLRSETGSPGKRDGDLFEFVVSHLSTKEIERTGARSCCGGCKKDCQVFVLSRVPACEGPEAPLMCARLIR